MNKSLLINTIVAVAMMATFYWVSKSIPTVIIFIFGTVASLLFYVFTSKKEFPNPDKLIPLYLFALANQFLHFGEEYYTNFEVEVSALLGLPVFSESIWILFNMGAYAIFVLGGVILYKKIRSLMIIPLFFIIVGVILNSIGHILISIYTGGYFPGLFTAILYLLIGPKIMKTILSASSLAIPQKP